MMLEPQVEISLIAMIGAIFAALISTVGLYLTARVNAKANVIKTQMDGQLTEVVALKEAVSFGKGEDKQREKQAIKEAVAEGIKQANGEPRP